MISKVEINLGEGNLEQGFNHINILVQKGASSKRMISILPSARDTKVIESYENWKTSHQDFYESMSWRNLNRPIEVCKRNNNVNADHVNSQYKKLKHAINEWLDTKDFRATEKQIRTALNEEDEIIVIISAKDDLAWQLPWHFWSFFDDYRKAEVVLSNPEYKKVNSSIQHSEYPKALIIIDDKGKRKDLDIWENPAIIEKIKLDVLWEEKISKEPLQDIYDKLFQQHWDIIFFAGHSSSYIKNGEPRLYISPNQYLTISQLQDPLREAIKQGLQLAIFNSCDGLGVARELLKLNLPQVIVMREDVPNKVAEQFLKYFLEAYVKGEPTFLAVRSARERLSALQEKFPGASLLPVMCFNPATDPLNFNPLSEINKLRVQSPLCMFFKQIFPNFLAH